MAFGLGAELDGCELSLPEVVAVLGLLCLLPMNKGLSSPLSMSSTATAAPGAGRALVDLLLPLREYTGFDTGDAIGGGAKVWGLNFDAHSSAENLVPAGDRSGDSGCAVDLKSGIIGFVARVGLLPCRGFVGDRPLALLLDLARPEGIFAAFCSFIKHSPA